MLSRHLFVYSFKNSLTEIRAAIVHHPFGHASLVTYHPFGSHITHHVSLITPTSIYSHSSP